MAEHLPGTGPAADLWRAIYFLYKPRLMMEEITRPTTVWMYKTCKNLVNNGINYQPQLLQDFFDQQYDYNSLRHVDDAQKTEAF